MRISSYLQYSPSLGERVYVADGAKVIGRAELGEHVSIWHNSVVRADVNFIRIGRNTNVQDLCMLHVTEQNALTLGENTSLGHSVVLHGCRIGNGCLIGMGAIILDGAVIGDNCLVAAGSLVSPGKVFPPGSLIKGRPAVLERPLTPEELERVSNHYKAYLGYKEQYLGMEEGDSKKKALTSRLAFLQKIRSYNIVLMSSSIAYFAALGLAPLLLILLSVGSLLGENLQDKILHQVTHIAPNAEAAMELVFRSLRARMNFSSFSGIFGLCFLLFLASFLFNQFRYCFDKIYDLRSHDEKKSVFRSLVNRAKVMLTVIAMCALFALSLVINPIFNFIIPVAYRSTGTQFAANFLILWLLFTGLYYFTPTKRLKLRECARISSLTTLAFMVGNALTGLYLKHVALGSLYGAAGGLLIFLLWAFYSALAIFTSAIFFQYFRPVEKI